MSTVPMNRAEFVEFVRAAKLGVVATIGAEGHPEAALVDLAVTEHGEVLFDTKAAARKVLNIGGNPRVALVVGWADRVSVQAEGDAEVLWGAEREKYGRIHQEQIQKSRAFREDFTLVKLWCRLELLADAESLRWTPNTRSGCDRQRAESAPLIFLGSNPAKNPSLGNSSRPVSCAG